MLLVRMPVVIKMKGLPFEATSKDIQLFFDGLHLEEDSIHLAAYRDGKASGVAFAVFHNDDDARQAMFRNENYLGKRYIELFLSSGSEMKAVLDSGVPGPRVVGPRSSQVRKRSDPFSGDRRSREREVRPKGSSDRRGKSEPDYDSRRVRNRLRSRSPIERRSLRENAHARRRPFEKMGRDRRNSSGPDERHVEMATNLFPNLLGMSHELGIGIGLGGSMGESYGSRERFEKHSFADSFDLSYSQHGKMLQEDTLGKGARLRNNDPLLDDVCVHLGGLPFKLSEEDVLSFFKGLDVVQIKFLYHPEGKFVGQKTGEGFVEFKSIRDAKQAAKKHREKLGHRYIDIKLVSKLDMMKSVEKNEMDIKKAGLDRSGLWDESDKSSHFRGPISDLAVKIDQDLLRQAGATSRPGERGTDLSCYAEQYGLPSESLQTIATLASSAKVNPDDVAAGCVVGIRNLPSSVTANEIIDLFYGYRVFSDSVRIHYLAPGRSSGDAMITFYNSKEAMSAIKELGHKNVGKRRVQLFLV